MSFLLEKCLKEIVAVTLEIRMICLGSFFTSVFQDKDMSILPKPHSSTNVTLNPKIHPANLISPTKALSEPIN